MKQYLARFRPYINMESAVMFDRMRESVGISYGKILLALLIESKTYVKLMERYQDATDKELNDIFLGLCSNDGFRL